MDLPEVTDTDKQNKNDDVLELMYGHRHFFDDILNLTKIEKISFKVIDFLWKL